MRQREKVLTEAQIVKYGDYLRNQEKCEATICKYLRDLRSALSFFSDGKLTKNGLIAWKGNLIENYAPSTVNTKLAAMNGFLAFNGWFEMLLKPLKIQKTLFRDGSRELSQQEYIRLIRAAERDGNRRLSLVIQTICATGIRVSELQFITAETVITGRAEINNKGKHRIIFLPEKLRRMLKEYLKQQKKTAGAVFVTRNGKPLDRTTIWRDMKTLCESAGVAPGKVFPHNLRHLFARTYYNIEKDLSRLADILGHSSVNTTKIYIIEDGYVHARQIERLGLIIT